MWVCHFAQMGLPRVDRTRFHAEEPKIMTEGGTIVAMTDPAAGLVVLDELERRFLRSAMLEWGGPARPTDELASALGFASAGSMPRETWELWQRIEKGQTLTSADWRRVLLAAEVAFASDVFGSGLDWPITSGISDLDSVSVLRRLQRKLPRWRDNVQFGVDEDGHVDLLNPRRPQP